ncbi:hypothetical protein BCR34DRAFT_629552 [Clohesyomyces aquaticus]|uniref:Thioredoxin-like fold domain-containing protein n=1 Tax=Clohesyomyces aquaticus TaxID=1231657 RepID=A0A1Y1Y1H1_9PLEO|nr:hypothetical protein BCR34DRAFT_629552 [Clohesyomyces aquaticus]
MTINAHPKITLYRGWPDPGQYVWSPFVTKLEFRLRISNVSYTCTSGSISSAPKGKIPYIDLESSITDAEVETLPDSTLIIKRLTSLGVIQDLNTAIQPRDVALDLALRALLEEKLYFCHTQERWIENYYTMRDHVLWAIPYPVRVFEGWMAWRANVKRLWDQGTGRLEREVVRGNGGEGKQADDGGCFWILGGEDPTEVDATIFGFVVSVLVCEA